MTAAFSPLSPVARSRSSLRRGFSTDRLRSSKTADAVDRMKAKAKAAAAAEQQEEEAEFSFFGLSRERVLRGVVSIDRGEFRWEFLTPWRKSEEDLTRIEKAIICVTFISLSVLLQAWLEPTTEYLQHFSYIANFFSYAIGNQVGFRIIAIVASLLEILSSQLDGFSMQKDAIPETYNVLFIVVNLYYVLRWALNRIDTLSAFFLKPIEAELFTRCFEPLGVRPYQYLKLLSEAKWSTGSEQDEFLTVEGDPVEALYVSVEGDFDVVSNGQRVASIPPFQVIGEVAALENLQSLDGSFHQAARATVVAAAGCRYVSWSHTTLYALKESDEEFARSISLAIARTLSHKLGSARQSTGRLLLSQTTRGNATLDELKEEARLKVGVAEVVAPKNELLYSACFRRRGFEEDVRAFNSFVALATTRLEDETEIIKEGGPPDKLIVLTRGVANGYVSGRRVRSFLPLQLINAPRFLETALHGNTELIGSSRSNLFFIEPATETVFVGGSFLEWRLEDVVAALNKDPALRLALNRLYAAVLREDALKGKNLLSGREQDNNLRRRATV